MYISNTYMYTVVTIISLLFKINFNTDFYLVGSVYLEKGFPWFSMVFVVQRREKLRALHGLTGMKSYRSSTMWKNFLRPDLSMSMPPRLELSHPTTSKLVKCSIMFCSSD